MLRIVWQLTVHSCGRTNAPFLKSSTRFAGASVGAGPRSQTANNDPVTTLTVLCARFFSHLYDRPVPPCGNLLFVDAGKTICREDAVAYDRPDRHAILFRAIPFTDGFRLFYGHSVPRTSCAGSRGGLGARRWMAEVISGSGRFQRCGAAGA